MQRIETEKHQPRNVRQHNRTQPLYDSINLPKRSGNLLSVAETFAETYGAMGLLQLHQL